VTTPSPLPTLSPMMEEGNLERLSLPNAQDIVAAAKEVCYVE
jgi:hypothetical protein